MSEDAVTTTLWPIAASGSWPVWVRLMVNSLQVDGTLIDDRLNFIMSLPSMATAQPEPAAAAPASAVASVALSAGVETFPVSAPWQSPPFPAESPGSPAPAIEPSAGTWPHGASGTERSEERRVGNGGRARG